MRQLAQQIVGDLGRRLGVVPGNLHVDGRGRTEVEDLSNNVCCEKRERHAGIFLTQLLPQRAHVVGRRMVIVVQGDKDVAIGGADNAGVAVRKVDAAIGQAQRIDHAAELCFGYGLTDDILDAVGKPRRLFDAQAGWRMEVQLDLATVHIREEVPTQPGHQQRDRQSA